MCLNFLQEKETKRSLLLQQMIQGRNVLAVEREAQESTIKNSKNAVSDANDNLSWIFKNISSWKPRQLEVKRRPLQLWSK